MGFVKTFEEILGNAPKSGDFYDAEMLTLLWETSPETIKRLLPPPLDPPQKPLALAFIAHYPSTNFSLPYKESALFIRASFEGQEGFYCLAMPVTNDMAMAGGREIWGYPKKLANIALQRTGDTVEGWTERHGLQFMKVTASLTGKINDNSAMENLLSLGLNPDGEYSSLAFNYKHAPSPVASEVFDYPPRLILGETVFRPKTFIFAEVDIELTPSDFDPWHEVPVERMLGGFYSVGDNSMLNDGKVLAEVDPIEFAPYAFLKWEWGKSSVATGQEQVSNEKKVDQTRQMNFTIDSTVGELLDNPISREFIDNAMPELVNHPAIKIIRKMTLRAVGPRSGGKLTEEILAIVDTELKKL